MAQTPIASPEKPLQLKTAWTENDAPLHVATEALMSVVGGLVYVTFGHVQIPLPKPGTTNPPDSAEITIVSRLAFTQETFQKFRKLFNDVAEQLQNAEKKGQ